MKIILGSSSAPRQQVLKDLGYEFEIIKPEIDEQSIRDADPRQLVLKLARAKADDIIKKVKEDSLIITGDSITVVNGVIREKAKDKEEAYRWIEEISQGVAQRQISSVVVTDTKTGERQEGVAEASVIFNPISKNDVSDFVESGAVFNHAGAYAIQKEPFTSRIKEVKGEMETIIGLPKTLTVKLLKSVL